MNGERGLPPALVVALGIALAGAGGAPERALTGLAAAAVAIALLVCGRPALAGAPRSLLWCCGGWLALGAVGVLRADAPDRALERLALWASCGLLAISASTLVRERSRAFVQSCLAAAGCIVAALALVAMPMDGRAALPFVNPNHLASWLLVPAALAVSALLTMEPRRRGNRELGFVWFGVFGAVGAALAATRSDGAGIAFLSAIGGLAVLRSSTTRGPWLAATGFALSALAIGIAPLLWPERIPAFGVDGESSAGLRWLLWGHASLAAVGGWPWGVGLGGFSDAFVAIRPAELRYAPAFAHSEPLQLVVELGLPACVGIVASLALGAHALQVALAQRTARTRWGLATACIAVFAHALVDFPFHVPAVAAAVAILVGLLFGAAASRGDAAGWSGSGPGATRAVLLGIALPLAAFAATQATVLRAESRADQLVAERRFDDAAVVVERALAWRPARPALWQRHARAHELRASFGPGGVAALAEAERSLAAAVQVAPSDPANHRALARIRGRLRDFEGASRALAAARRLDPHAPAAAWTAAHLHLAQGEAHAAGAQLGAGLVREPSVALRSLRALLDATGDPASVAAAGGRDGLRESAAWLLAQRGFPAAAAEVLRPFFLEDPRDGRRAARLATLYLQAGAFDRAAQSLVRARAAAPEDLHLGRIARQIDDARRGGDGG